MSNTFKQTLLAGSAIMVGAFTSAAYADGSGQQPEADVMTQRIDAIQQKYAPLFAELQDEGNGLARDAEHNKPSGVGAAVGFDLKIGTHRENIVLHVPEFSMRLQRIVMTVPEVAMREQRWVYGVPSVRMERVKVGQHPEWHGLFRVEFKDNYMDLPKPYIQQVTTILHVPEFKMGNQEIKLHLPNVVFREQRWSFDVPDFTVKDVHVETKHMSDVGAELEARGQALANRMKAETDQVLREELPKKRAEIVARFADNEQQLVAAISEAHRFNVDTSKPFPDGGPALDDELRQLRSDRDSALLAIDVQITQVVS